MNCKYLGIIFAFIGSLWFPLSSQAQYAHAGEYMDAISVHYSELLKDQWAYIKASSHSRNARKVEKRRRELLATNMRIQSLVRRMPPYEGDASLRDSTVAFLSLCYKVINKDFGKIVDMEAVAEESYDAMEAYLLAKELANKRLNDAGDRLEVHEELFASTHNVNLIEAEQSKTSKRLAQASKTIGYYNRVYLVFFKSYKQELYLMDAVEQGDISGIVQNQNALLSTTEEGFAKLDTMSNFEGDGSVKAACRELLKFYQQEAEKQAPVFSDFYVKKESFEQIQAALEGKKPKDRTQEDVDRYNAAVNAYNEAAAAFNKTSNSTNEMRNRLIETYNKTADKFMDQHVP